MRLDYVKCGSILLPQQGPETPREFWNEESEAYKLFCQDREKNGGILLSDSMAWQLLPVTKIREWEDKARNRFAS